MEILNGRIDKMNLNSSENNPKFIEMKRTFKEVSMDDDLNKDTKKTKFTKEKFERMLEEKKSLFYFIISNFYKDVYKIDLNNWKLLKETLYLNRSKLYYNGLKKSNFDPNFHLDITRLEDKTSDINLNSEMEYIKNTNFDKIEEFKKKNLIKIIDKEKINKENKETTDIKMISTEIEVKNRIGYEYPKYRFEDDRILILKNWSEYYKSYSKKINYNSNRVCSIKEKLNKKPYSIYFEIINNEYSENEKEFDIYILSIEIDVEESKNDFEDLNESVLISYEKLLKLIQRKNIEKKEIVNYNEKKIENEIIDIFYFTRCFFYNYENDKIKVENEPNNQIENRFDKYYNFKSFYQSEKFNFTLVLFYYFNFKTRDFILKDFEVYGLSKNHFKLYIKPFYEILNVIIKELDFFKIYNDLLQKFDILKVLTITKLMNKIDKLEIERDISIKEYKEVANAIESLNLLIRDILNTIDKAKILNVDKLKIDNDIAILISEKERKESEIKKNEIILKLKLDKINGINLSITKFQKEQDKINNFNFKEGHVEINDFLKGDPTPIHIDCIKYYKNKII